MAATSQRQGKMCILKLNFQTKSQEELTLTRTSVNAEHHRQRVKLARGGKKLTYSNKTKQNKNKTLKGMPLLSIANKLISDQNVYPCIYK